MKRSEAIEAAARRFVRKIEKACGTHLAADEYVDLRDALALHRDESERTEILAICQGAGIEPVATLASCAGDDVVDRVRRLAAKCAIAEKQWKAHAALAAQPAGDADLLDLLQKWYARWDAYRMMHDTHGEGSPQAGRAWDDLTAVANETLKRALAAARKEPK